MHDILLKNKGEETIISKGISLNIYDIFSIMSRLIFDQKHEKTKSVLKTI
jgi:hypothetical protein